MLQILGGFFAGLMIGIGLGGTQKDCPRVLVGYQHRANHCDHSYKALSQAYQTLHERELNKEKNRG